MDFTLMQEKGTEINKVVLLAVDKIGSNRSQPRSYFDRDSLEDLCRSIEASGLLQPVTVRRLPAGEYELIAGERRLMAFRALGRAHIPAIVEDCSDAQSAVLALVENLQRRDLNYFEEAVGISRLMQELNLTQQQASQTLGKAQSTIANKLRLLRYSPPARDMILRAGLTERHARAMLSLPDLDDLTPIENVIKGKLNVEQTEKYVQSLLAAQKPKSTRLVVIKDMRIFLNSINKAVKLMQGAGIEVDSQKRESDEYIEVVIRIPKSAAYRNYPVGL